MEDPMEFLTKCWCGHLFLRNRVFYAYGNTEMKDLFEDFRVDQEVDVLMLGVGDVRHVVKTVAGLAGRPASAGLPHTVRFHLNDVDSDMIARDVILLEIVNQLDPEKRSDVEFLWSVWYNFTLLKCEVDRLRVVLETAIDTYSNVRTQDEGVCRFGDRQTNKSVLKIWTAWSKSLSGRTWKVETISRRRVDKNKSHWLLGFDGTFSNVQIFTGSYSKDEPKRTSYGNEMIKSLQDGFVRFSGASKGKEFINPTFMRPGSDGYHCEIGKDPAAAFLPLDRLCVAKSMYEACLSKLQQTLISYKRASRTTSVKLTVWCCDAISLCTHHLAAEVQFDFINTSNLVDHLGLINILLACQPRLKSCRSVLATETLNWNQQSSDLTVWLKFHLDCPSLLLPTLYGVRFADDIDMGTTNVRTYYRSSNARFADYEVLYWTRAPSQNVPIDLDKSPDVLTGLVMVASMCCPEDTNMRGDPRNNLLTLFHVLLRLQHTVLGGMKRLLGIVGVFLNVRPNVSYQLSLDALCWLYRYTDKQDELLIIKFGCGLNLPPDNDDNFTQFNSIARLWLSHQVNGRSVNEVLSLFYFDSADRCFRVGLLRSSWSGITDSQATIHTSITLHQTSEILFNTSTIENVYKTPCQVSHTTVQQQKGVACREFIKKYEVDIDMSRLQVVLSPDSTLESIDSVANILDISLVDKPRYSCCVEPYSESLHLDAADSIIQLKLQKKSLYNTGRSALPLRLIEDGELTTFDDKNQIKNYLKDTMLCDMMFCCPRDINLRAIAMRCNDLVVDDPFLALRILTQLLWTSSSMQPRMVLRTADGAMSSLRDNLDLVVKGFYLHRGLPLVKLRLVDVRIAEKLVLEGKLNQLEVDTARQTNTDEKLTININCSSIAKANTIISKITNLLQTNRQQVQQDDRNSKWSFKTVLAMMFPRTDGVEMNDALKNVATASSEVAAYIEKMYPAQVKAQFEMEGCGRSFNNPTGAQQLSNMFSIFGQQASLNPFEELIRRQHYTGVVTLDTCIKCGAKTSDLKKCSRCKQVVYCSKQCQKEHWSIHRRVCNSTP